MTTWIVKSETDDPKLALELVESQRNHGAYTAWIEDERGQPVDEESLKTHKAKQTTPTLKERGIGILVEGVSPKFPVAQDD
jgi:hypothetical protein